MSYSPRTKKSLGQHFLKDQNMINKIVGSLDASPGDRIIEIGPGDGALTEFLRKEYKDLLAIEIDQRMVKHLTEKFPDLNIIQEDILKTDWKNLIDVDRPVHIIGNLPYYITSQILFAVLEERKYLETATFMMQKEVAERIVAKPNNKQYGILSVQTQLMSSPEILFDVPPHVFSPPPKVNSSVIKLTFDKPKLACSDTNLKTVVRMAFNQRRKKLSNALKRLNARLPADDFDFTLRAEALAPSEYEKLTAQLETIGVFD